MGCSRPPLFASPRPRGLLPYAECQFPRPRWSVSYARCPRVCLWTKPAGKIAPSGRGRRLWAPLLSISCFFHAQIRFARPERRAIKARTPGRPRIAAATGPLKTLAAGQVPLQHRKSTTDVGVAANRTGRALWGPALVGQRGGAWAERDVGRKRSLRCGSRKTNLHPAQSWR